MGTGAICIQQEAQRKAEAARAREGLVRPDDALAEVVGMRGAETAAEARRRVAELEERLTRAEARCAELAADLGQSERLNEHLAAANARAAELMAEIELKNEQLAAANARAAELMAEIELKNEEIEHLNGALAKANAYSAELMAELEERRLRLQEANACLASANEEKNRILGIAAHDIRGGIGAIAGVADLVHEQLSEGDTDVDEFVQVIRSETTYLLALLEDLLDVSRIEAGKVNLMKRLFNLNELVADAGNIHRTALHAKAQDLVVDLPDKPIYLEADRAKLGQVVDNLLSNAVKYSMPGTTVKIRAWRDGREALVAVEDEGPGLTAEDLEMLFQPFGKLSAQPTGGESSHGLGLAIAKKVVDAHKGRIWVDNLPTRGARFAFALPLVASG